jgi:hypothetical protein
MASHHPRANTAHDRHLVPPILATWLSVFRPCFTAPVWARVLVLVAGAVLAPGKRTVTQVLRVMGLADEAGFRRYHEVLSRARWDERAVARRLLHYIIERLLPDGDVVMGVDDTIERRWGACIKARGIYRQGQRSALAVADGFRANSMVWADLVAAVPDGPGAVGGMERGKRQAAQNTDDVGQAGHSANQTLAAQPPSHHCRRQRIFGARSARRGPPPCLHGHAVADGRQPVQASAQAAEEAAGAHTGEGKEPAEIELGAEEQEDGLDERGRLSMVQRPAAHIAGRHGHRGVVALWHPTRADTLGAGARSVQRA